MRVVHVTGNTTIALQVLAGASRGRCSSRDVLGNVVHENQFLSLSHVGVIRFSRWNTGWQRTDLTDVAMGAASPEVLGARIPTSSSTWDFS